MLHLYLPYICDKYKIVELYCASCMVKTGYLDLCLTTF